MTLTEQHLLDYGGIKVGHRIEFYLDDRALLVNWDKTRERWWVEIREGDEIEPQSNWIITVEDFERYFFALTGKEL